MRVSIVCFFLSVLAGCVTTGNSPIRTIRHECKSDASYVDFGTAGRVSCGLVRGWRDQRGLIKVGGGEYLVEIKNDQIVLKGRNYPILGFSAE